jgi:light-regulated signal transduction histidine kinase (bacteriophytochrome)
MGDSGTGGVNARSAPSSSRPGLDTNPASLFEAYVRGPNAKGRGLGLGLATVKRIVEAHYGRVGVRSTAEGCTFWFTLPRQTASERHSWTDDCNARHTQSGASGAPGRILLP